MNHDELFCLVDDEIGAPSCLYQDLAQWTYCHGNTFKITSLGVNDPGIPSSCPRRTPGRVSKTTRPDKPKPPQPPKNPLNEEKPRSRRIRALRGVLLARKWFLRSILKSFLPNFFQ